MMNLNDDDTKANSSFWSRNICGEPLWFVVGMGALPFYLGLLATALHYDDTLLPCAIGAMIVCAAILVIRSFVGQR